MTMDHDFDRASHESHARIDTCCTTNNTLALTGFPGTPLREIKFGDKFRWSLARVASVISMARRKRGSASPCLPCGVGTHPTQQQLDRGPWQVINHCWPLSLSRNMALESPGTDLFVEAETRRYQSFLLHRTRFSKLKASATEKLSYRNNGM